jgi:hypothetical protein
LLAENDDITQGGAWTIAGTTFLNAGVYDILLTEPGNVLGPLSVTGANIIIATAADLKVTGASYSGVLNLSTTADLMVSGPVSGNGAANLSAGGEIVFTSTGSIVGEADVTLIADQDQTGGGGIFFEDGAFIDAGSRTIDLSATDDITLGRLTTTNATAAAIRVTSTAGGILDGGDLGGADLEANALGAVVTLSAGGPIGALDAPDAPLDLRVNELVASTGSDASLEEADGLLVQILAAPDGSVALTSLAGDIHVVEVLALARATLAAPGGSVVGDGSGPHVTARDLEALAATGVSLVTVLQRLEAGGGTGGIAIENNSSLIVGGIPSSLVTGLSATNSDIELTVHGALTVLEAVQTTGSGAIDVAADGSLIVRAPFSTQVGDQTLSAGGDIVFSSAGSVVGEADVSLIADQDQMGGGGIFFANGAFIDAGSRTIILSATDDITLGRLTTANATAAAIRVESASGGIFDGGDLGGADIEAN